MATPSVFVEGNGERDVGSGVGNGLSVRERDILRYKATNIIVVILC